MRPMRHPEIHEYPQGYPVPVSEAQAMLWGGKGWVEVEGEPVDYSKMRKGQLLDEVERLGLEMPDQPTVSNLRAVLEADQTERLSVLNETEVDGEPVTSTEED